MTDKNQLFARYPALYACKSQIQAALQWMVQTAKSGNKFLLCGNGGSCADCAHITGELMKEFLCKRPIPKQDANRLEQLFPKDAAYMRETLQQAVPAISLMEQTAALTAYANDVCADMAYAQMVYGYGTPGDLLICISTSGSSNNILYAAKAAKLKGMHVMGMTGSADCPLHALCDTYIAVPARQTYQVQENHLPVYHFLCAALERELFGKEAGR